MYYRILDPVLNDQMSEPFCHHGAHNVERNRKLRGEACGTVCSHGLDIFGGWSGGTLDSTLPYHKGGRGSTWKEGTYLPPPKHCCDNSKLINNRCVCKPGYHGPGCVQPCNDKCKENEVCDEYTFTCSCKPGFIKFPPSTECKPPCGGDCIENAQCNERTNNCECVKPFIGNPKKKCYLPCGGHCIPNAQCNNSTNQCECIKPFIGNPKVKCYKPSKFALKRPTHEVTEDGKFVKIQVTRIEGIFGSYDVKWETKDISAEEGKDYEKKSGVVKFAYIQAVAFIYIPIIDDKIHESDEKFSLTLLSVNNGGDLGTLVTTVVTIHDDDLPCGGKCKKNSYCNIKKNECVCNKDFVFYHGLCEKPCFGRCCLNAFCNETDFKCRCKPGFHGNPLKQCEKPSVFILQKEEYEVKENVGELKIVVLRTVSSLGTATVRWEAIDGTAKHGPDYIHHAGNLFFKDGQTSQTIIIEIFNDQFHEEEEEFTVKLDKVVSGEGSIGSPDEAVVTITDDDLPCHGRCKDNAECDESKHICVCKPTYVGNAYKGCHKPCHDSCLPNATCKSDQCVCNGDLVGDGVKKCEPPCGDRCKRFKYAHCDAKTNKCICNDTYHGNPYSTTGCVCGTTHY